MYCPLSPLVVEAGNSPVAKAVCYKRKTWTVVKQACWLLLMIDFIP